MPHERTLQDIARLRAQISGHDDKALAKRHRLAEQAVERRADNLHDLAFLVDLLVEYVRPDDEPTLAGPLTRAIKESVAHMIEEES